MQFIIDHWVIILFAGVGIFSLVFYVFWMQRVFLNRQMFKRHFMYEKELEYRVRKSGENRPEQEELAAALKEKKAQLLKLPNLSFHYVDETRVRNFYTDYFREPTVESMIKELVTETSAEIKGALPQLLETKLGGSNLNKWISTIKLPDTSLNGMFLKYQKETLRNGQVTLDLELLDVELSDVDEFQRLIEKLDKDLEFSVEKSAVDENVKRLKERAAERTLAKLEEARGWAIIRGSFTIEQDQEFYHYRYEHPVNQYLATKDQAVTIEATVPVDAIESHVAGNYKQSAGSSIPIIIYGEVWQPISRNTGAMALKITPLVIY